MGKRLQRMKQKAKNVLRSARIAFGAAALLGLGALAGCQGPAQNNSNLPPAPDAGLTDSGMFRPDGLDCSPLSYSNKCTKGKNKVRCILHSGKSVKFDGVAFRYKQKKDGFPIAIEAIDTELGCGEGNKTVDLKNINGGNQSGYPKLMGLVTMYGTSYVVTVSKVFELQDPTSTGYQDKKYVLDVTIERINGNVACKQMGSLGTEMTGKRLNVGDKLSLKNLTNPSPGVNLSEVTLSKVIRLQDGSKKVVLKLENLDGTTKSLEMDDDSLYGIEDGSQHPMNNSKAKIIFEARNAVEGSGATLTIHGCM